MWMVNLAISCLTTSSLSWFMNLTLRVPIQYYSLQHWTLLSPPDTTTNENHFCFGPAMSYFLELFIIALCSSPVAYWTHSNLGGLIFWHIFLPFYTALGIFQARVLKWVAISSSNRLCFVRTFHYDLSFLAFLIVSLSYASPFAVIHEEDFFNSWVLTTFDNSSPFIDKQM